MDQLFFYNRRQQGCTAPQYQIITSVIGSKSRKVLGSSIRSGKSHVKTPPDFCGLIQAIGTSPPGFTLVIESSSGGITFIFGLTGAGLSSAALP
jgi:hypothetical protein